MITFCVDFDGTCTTHDYPSIGKDIGAQKVLKNIVKLGHRIILFTMRSDKELQEAVHWFTKNGIPLWQINKNPEQIRWTKSPKVYADFYIDDLAIGCPLKFDEKLSSSPFVDWQKIEKILRQKNLIK